MGLGYNIFASAIVASLFISLGLVVRQAANQSINEMFGIGCIISFTAIFTFCMITLTYQDKTNQSLADESMEEKR